MSSATLARSFLAVEPDTAGRGALLDLQNALQQAWDLPLSGWVHHHDLHLTLQFLGDLSPEQASDCMRLLQPVCAAAEPFELAFEHLALWPQPRPRLAVALFEATPALLALAQPAREWAQAQGIALDPRPFQAHVTLIRSGRPLPPAPAFKLAPFALRVGRITLMHRGPPGAIRYQRFASHELGCAG